MNQHLILNNFRNYEYFKIDISNNIHVLTGHNGRGKTNVLEALSLFSGGRGLRHANSIDMVNSLNNDKNFWNITLSIDGNKYSLGYKDNKRIYKIEDRNTKNFHEFQKNYYILWMTYETDRLFVESPANRRHFIDMFANTKFPITHIKNLKAYDKLSRERLKILNTKNEKGSSYFKWLDVLENQIGPIGLEIANARISVINDIEFGQDNNNKEFPKFTNKMIGKLEENLSLETYKQELFHRREKDRLTNSTTYGPNRSDWQVYKIAKEKNNSIINAHMCSAGEQKILLLGVFLSFLQKNILNDNRNLILLLDDVIAHLDEQHRDFTFRYIKNLIKFFEENNKKIMVWLTGTNKIFFQELKDIAIFSEV